jgi:restriction system protein
MVNHRRLPAWKEQHKVYPYLSDKLMAVPTYDKFIEPILRYLAANPGGAAARDVHEAAATALGISEPDRQQLLSSGTQLVYKNRAGWAHDRLKRAALSSSPRRGHWQLTEKGQAYALGHPAPLSAEDVLKLAVGYMDVRLAPASSTDTYSPQELDQQPLGPTAAASPDDRLGEALAEMRQSVAVELLETLGTVSPSFFEVIVLDVLHRMGYGASRDDLQRVGGTGDGGIDGIISLDKLGLEKVYVQAKRWQPPVGRPEVQAFYGALAGQHANKGVFITTSRYTPDAVAFAKSVQGIVLVDGARLAQLMIDHEVGVSSRTVRVPKIDSDYFDEEAT